MLQIDETCFALEVVPTFRAGTSYSVLAICPVYSRTLGITGHFPPDVQPYSTSGAENDGMLLAALTTLINLTALTTLMILTNLIILNF